MGNKADVRELILDMLEEQALSLGGLVAVYEVDDKLVERLVAIFNVSRRNVLRRLEGTGLRGDCSTQTHDSTVRPHPAIEEFLELLRGG